MSSMGCFRNGGGRRMVFTWASASYTQPEYWEHFAVTGNRVSGQRGWGVLGPEGQGGYMRHRNIGFWAKWWHDESNILKKTSLIAECHVGWRLGKGVKSERNAEVCGGSLQDWKLKRGGLEGKVEKTVLTGASVGRTVVPWWVRGLSGPEVGGEEAGPR